MREGKSKRNQKQNTKMQKKKKTKRKSFKKQTTSSNFYTIYEYILM